MKASIHFDNRKPVKNDQGDDVCHVKIFVSFDGPERVRRVYKTGVFLTRSEFNKVMVGKYGKVSTAEADRLESARKKLQERLAKANECCQFGISPDEFEQRFNSEGGLKNPLDILLGYSEELRADGQIGTAIFYRSAYSSFKKFVDQHHGGKVSFIQVTPKWLLKYEKWLIEQGRSYSTVGTHMRPMRTIFIKARDLRLIPADLYPFGKNKYRIPSGKSRKIALDEADKNKVLKYKGDQEQAVDLWKFSYYCNGMNFNDIARIKRAHIVDGVLTYLRGKTKNVEADKTPQIITLRKEAMQIIAKWGARDLSPDAYIFPVLRPGLTPAQEKYLIADWIKDVNASLAIAAVELKIRRITTYWARHTFATILKRKGVSIEYIQEALGHSSPETTKIYLGSFDLETKRKVTKLL